MFVYDDNIRQSSIILSISNYILLFQYTYYIIKNGFT